MTGENQAWMKTKLPGFMWGYHFPKIKKKIQNSTKVAVSAKVRPSKNVSFYSWIVPALGEVLRGCPPKNRPLNSDQNFDFLQNFSTRHGLYKVKENTFLWVLFSIIVEILRRT